MHGSLKLSQCMIVKDEEENIEKALLWGKGIVWEQIVVDTGSTDRTVELAEAMGAQVYHFSWIDDFAAAKNYAIEQATGDWIAFLDADEYIKEEEARKILPLLQKAEESGCYAVQMVMYCVDESEVVGHVIRHTRFFKRIPELRFEGMIHEHLVLANRRSLSHYLMNDMETVAIYHSGYSQEAVEKKKKRERNLRILLKALEREPENYHTMGDLGDHFVALGDEEEAEKWYREAIQRIPRTKAAQCDRNVKSFLNLMHITRKKEDEQELVRLYEDINGRFCGIYDADYILGEFYAVARADYQKGIFYLERALQVLEQYGTSNYGPVLLGNLPKTWEMLADCYYKSGDSKSCVVRCVGLLKADKRHQKVLELLLQAFSKENPQSIVYFLSKIYSMECQEDREILIQACKNSGSQEVLDILQKNWTGSNWESLFSVMDEYKKIGEVVF